ncbi:glutamyl-tRNA synthetase [Pancytospora philotis]|nr:glutamyl-tRNA synthetase [Pancytospora philotis]
MAENVAKADFLNFLMSTKHGIDKQRAPVILSHIEALDAPQLLREFDTDFSPEALDAWLARLAGLLPVDDPVLADLIFGILYSSEQFVKAVRSKEFAYAAVAEFYKRMLLENRKSLAEYNKGEKGRVNISAPARVVTRFPPEPSGYLHIGHAKAALLNQLMAKDGQLIVRFDDTNPEKESKVFEDAILEDLKLLKITDYRLTYSSSHFDVIYDYATQLIKSGKAYADNTEKERMRQERTDGVPSGCRETAPEETLRIFAEMNAGRCRDYCLRAKISVDNPNKAMRDPVIYRCADKQHHKTGDKYRIYPTYDFTVPIVDSLEGVTLSLRSNEYRDRNPVYYWFIEALGLENRPKIHDFSRLCFDNTVVSKRQMKFYVEHGFVAGWDDPRLCTLRGLRRSGMDMDALIEYIRLQGASQKSAVNSWDKIWAMNKRVIDPKSARYSAVPLGSCVVCTVEGFDGPEAVEVPRHKKVPELGTKRLLFGDEILVEGDDAAMLEVGEEFTLMSWGNAVVLDKVVADGRMSTMKLRLNPTGDFKATKNKITWVSRKGAVCIKLYEYGSLQNEVSTDDLAAKFNKDSKKESWWLAEHAIGEVAASDFIQIERVGFFFCDKLLEFNLVPFTKQKRVY